jgi:hypothetical protein
MANSLLFASGFWLAAANSGRRDRATVISPMALCDEDAVLTLASAAEQGVESYCPRRGRV